jgi:hypothetical protein
MAAGMARSSQLSGLLSLPSLSRKRAERQQQPDYTTAT